MEILTQFNHNIKTMSSREISEICGKAHRNVCRDIENLNTSYVGLGLLKIEQGYYTHQSTGNQQHREFLLTKEQCIDLITGYKAELRIKINRRWAELEAQITKPVMDLNNPEFLRQALLGYTEKVIQLEHQVQTLEPKAQALDVIADTTNTYCIRECAKTIGIKESELIQLLIDKKWVYRDAAKKLQPHAQYTLNGVFTNRTSPVIKNHQDGQERVFLHMRVTAFGLTRITGLVEKARKVKVAA
jgi:phage antirepressor YoqD-like protein/phage regulator Rha-like protein